MGMKKLVLMYVHRVYTSTIMYCTSYVRHDRGEGADSDTKGPMTVSDGDDASVLMVGCDRGL